MSDLLNLLNGDKGINQLIANSRKADTLFSNATWDQVGSDKQLTDFLHKSLDPSGSKYGGDTEALKTDLLNQQTARGSSAIASIWDAIGAHSEGIPKKQFENLLGRLYEQAPNRLVSGDMAATGNALGAGLAGAVGLDMPLNLLFGAGTLSKLGIGGGKAGLEKLGQSALTSGAEDAVRLANTGAAEQAVRDAIAGASGQMTKDLTWAGAKQGAKVEATGGAVMGGLGDVGQQDAAVQRGLQEDISGVSTLANVAGGGILGGAFGGIGGAFEGRGVAKGLLKDGGMQREMLGQQRAISNGLADDMGLGTGTQPDTIDPGFVTFDDAYRDSRANLHDATGDLSEFTNMVVKGDSKSRYTPEQLDVLQTAITDLQGSGNLSESYKTKANALRAKGDPDSLLAAQDMEQRATAYERFVQHLAKNDMGNGELFSSGDISPDFISLISKFDRSVAEAFTSVVPPAGAAKGAAPTAKAPAGSVSPASPPGAAAAAGSPGEPPPGSAGSSAASPASPVSPTHEAAAATTVEAPGEPTASDVQKMAETVFTPDEKQAVADLNALAAKASLDLQGVLDAIKTTGSQQQVISDVAKAAGVDRGVVSDAVTKVTAATQKAHSKVVADVEAANKAAADAQAAAKAASTEPPKESPAAPAAEAATDAPPATDESVAASEAALEDMAVHAATVDYTLMTTSLNGQVTAVSKVLDDALVAIDALAPDAEGVKVTADAKVAEVTKLLDKAAADNPDLAPMLDRLDPKKLTSKKGVANAKVLLKSMAQDAVSFSYAKIVGDVLPDSLNVDAFDAVLRSLLRGVPTEDVDRISQNYRHLVHDALLQRIRAIGIDLVQKDPVLGPAWNRIVQGAGGYQPFGGKSNVKVDIGEMVHRYSQRIVDSVQGDLTKTGIKMENAIKAVRDFMNQLQQAGVPLDSQFMERALDMRAMHAVDDVINDVFTKENKEGFDKLNAMRELRERDRSPTAFSRTPNHGRNPFFGSLVDNPVLQRMEDAEGNVSDMIISGRSQPRGANGQRTVGRPQSSLSDGISDYFGTLWAKPRSLFAAAGAARRAIYGAAVDAASWSAGTMMIDGMKFSGPIKALKGLFAEKVHQRMEQARFGLILDTVERRNLDSANPRYLSEDAYKAQIERISGMERPVTADELYVANMMIDSHERMQTANVVARAHISEVLADSAEMGESAADRIVAIVTKTQKFLADNNNNLMAATRDARLRLTEAASSRSKMVKDGKGGKRKEGSATGTPAKEKPQSDQPKLYTMKLMEDGAMAPSSRDATDAVTVKIGGVDMELVPGEHLSMLPDGRVTLFGRDVGVWNYDVNPAVTRKKPIVTIDAMGIKGEMVDDFSSIVKRQRFSKAFQDILKENQDKLHKAKAKDLPEGSSIPKELSETNAVKEAQRELLNDAAVKQDDLGKIISSFTVPEGRVLALKRKGDSRIIKPMIGAESAMTLREFIASKGLKIEDLEVGTIPAGRVSKAGKAVGLSTQEYMLKEFVAMGRDTGKGDPTLVKALAAKKENATTMQQAQHRAISYKEAGEIKVDGERTLADVYDAFNASIQMLQWGKIPDLETLNVMISAYQHQATLIESIAPHGIKRDNASRRTSFHWLQERMAAFTPEEKNAALDLLRRLDTSHGQMPYFEGGGSNSFGIGVKEDAGSSRITLSNRDDSIPKHVVVMHEVGHWAFLNILTPTERVDFLRSLAKYYPAGGGPISEQSIMAAMPNAKALESATGKSLKGATKNTNELFAWQFTNHAMNVMTGAVDGPQAAIDQTMWAKVAKKVKSLLQHFLGQPIDKDMLPLFEKILPSTISERKFDYNVLVDQNDGKLVPIADARKHVSAVTGVMEKIDTLRSNLAATLLTPGGGADAGFVQHLEDAAKHMFGLLYGKIETMTVSKLRSDLLRFTRNKTGDDRWVRDAKGKVVKDAEGHGVVTQLPREGSVDPRDLFSRSETGKLMQAIRDVTPEGAADGVAFEAAVGSEQFNAILKDTSIGSNPEVSAVFNQAMEQEFKRQMTSGVKEDAALDAAETFAYKEAASYAKESLGIDITADLFDSTGGRVKLGSDQQRAALGEVGRKLYDLMSDALDNLDTQVKSFGYDLQKVKRELVQPEKTSAEVKTEQVVEKAAAKVRKPRVKKAAPVTKESAAVVAREESERVDGNQTGVPAGAPPTVSALISKVPHRNPEQAGIIETMMYRVFSHVMGDNLDRITNADVARLAGVPLESGHAPQALASSGTAAFESLRAGFRLASEHLTNPNHGPRDAVQFIVDLLANARKDAFNDEFPGMPRADGSTPQAKASDISGAVMRLLSGSDIGNDLAKESAGWLNELLADATDIVSGLGTTAQAKRVLPETVATPGRTAPVKFAGGGYNPLFAASSVAMRLRDLPVHVATHLLEKLGIKVDGGVAQTLSRNIVYAIKGDGNGRRVFTTSEELHAYVNANLVNEDIAKRNAEIAKIMSGKSPDMDRVDYLNASVGAWMQELHGDNGYVIPMLVDMSRVYDPMTANEAQKLALQTAMGASKKQDTALKSLGYIGTMEGETARLFSVKSASDLEREIADAVKKTRKADIPDAPLIGELVLNMALDDASTVSPLAVEQRALQAGSTPGVAKVISNMFKRKTSRAAEEGITEADAAEVRYFSGLQFRDNASRILKVGGEWLANVIAPREGTGFYEALFTKLSSTLSPVMADLDALTGVKWWSRPYNEIRRNLTMSHSIWQHEAESRIVMAMRTGDNTGLSLDERKLYASINNHFRDMLQMQRDAGIMVGDVTDATNRNYVPQRFNTDWIRANRDEAINLLGKWFEKDRMANGGSVINAKADARKVINEALNREELQGIIDGTSSTYAQAFGDKLHSRKLRIVGKDWEAMAPMFDNNLRSLLISYTEAAHKRVEWSNRFGIKGHAADTYVDIADRGSNAVIDALMGKATAMKYAREGASDVDTQIEFEAANLFTPMAKAPEEASRIASNVTKLLENMGKDPASRQGIVDDLVNEFVRTGGAGADHFRKRAEAIVNGLADFGDQGGTVAAHEREFMLKMVGTLGGRPAYTMSANQGARNLAAGIKTFNSVTLLGGALLSSLADPSMSLLRSGSGKAWLSGTAKAVKGAMSDPAYAAAMMRIGVGMEGTLSENLTHVNGGISGRVSNAFFQATLLTPWTNANRQVAAMVGFESIKANQVIVQREMFNGTTNSWAYRKSIRYLRQLGLAELAQGKQLDDFAEAVNNQKVAEALHKFVSESVFQPNRNDSPLWTQDPIASIFWQFKSYPMMMGRLVKRNFKEALAYEGGSVIDKLKGKDVGQYAGDPMGLMYLMTVGAAAGMGALSIKDVAFGKNDQAGDARTLRDYRISKIMQDFGFKDASIDNETLDMLAGAYVNGLLSLGALGFLGDLVFQSAKNIDNGAFGRERILSQIAGPTLGTFQDSIQVLEGAQNALAGEPGDGNEKQRNAVRKVLKRIPIFGQQSPWVETFVDDVAGESNK